METLKAGSFLEISCVMNSSPISSCNPALSATSYARNPLMSCSSRFLVASYGSLASLYACRCILYQGLPKEELRGTCRTNMHGSPLLDEGYSLTLYSSSSTLASGAALRSFSRVTPGLIFQSESQHQTIPCHTNLCVNIYLF